MVQFTLIHSIVHVQGMSRPESVHYYLAYIMFPRLLRPMLHAFLSFTFLFHAHAFKRWRWR